MRYATIFLGSFALLFSAGHALADDPLTAASRDAQHLADCTKALDAHCAASLYDARGYELVNAQTRYPGQKFDPSKDLARVFDTMRRTGVRYTYFETSVPQELFSDGVRLYAFVPYGRTVEDTNERRVSQTRSFLIALSADAGKTWTFVDGEGLTPDKIRYIVPSYADQPLPRTIWVDGRTE